MSLKMSQGRLAHWLDLERSAHVPWTSGPRPGCTLASLNRAPRDSDSMALCGALLQAFS